MKSYSELIKLKTFEERLDYLMLNGVVGDETFGGKRYLNQTLYKSPEWRRLRHRLIIRDGGCDLAHADYDLGDQPIFLHHIEPVSIDDILNRDPKVFDPDNIVCCSYNTHQAIHYAIKGSIPPTVIERKPGDTCPWKTAF